MENETSLNCFERQAVGTGLGGENQLKVTPRIGEVAHNLMEKEVRRAHGNQAQKWTKERPPAELNQQYRC